MEAEHPSALVALAVPRRPDGSRRGRVQLYRRQSCREHRKRIVHAIGVALANFGALQVGITNISRTWRVGPPVSISEVVGTSDVGNCGPVHAALGYRSIAGSSALPGLGIAITDRYHSSRLAVRELPAKEQPGHGLFVTDGDSSTCACTRYPPFCAGILGQQAGVEDAPYQVILERQWRAGIRGCPLICWAGHCCAGPGGDEPCRLVRECTPSLS